MFKIAKTLLGVILVVLALAVPACVTVNKTSEGSDTEVGGRHGIVVEHEKGVGTDVHVGGDKGVNVDHGTGQGTDVHVGGDKGVNVDH